MVTEISNDVWLTRIDGKLSDWLMGWEERLETTAWGPGVAEDYVVGPLLRAVDMAILPWNLDNPDFDDEMCPLVVRLEAVGR